jgi:hypothetical protein
MELEAFVTEVEQRECCCDEKAKKCNGHNSQRQ